MKKLKMKQTSLNYSWDYIPDYKDSFIKSFPTSKKVNIPHTNIEIPYNNFDENIYQFASSYQKIFEFKKIRTKRYTIHFDGVMAFAKVYVNEQLVVTHKGGGVGSVLRLNAEASLTIFSAPTLSKASRKS